MSIFLEGSALYWAREVGRLQGKLELSEQWEKLHGQHLIAKARRDEYAARIEEITRQLARSREPRVRERNKAAA